MSSSFPRLRHSRPATGSMILSSNYICHCKRSSQEVKLLAPSTSRVMRSLVSTAGGEPSATLARHTPNAIGCQAFDDTAHLPSPTPSPTWHLARHTPNSTTPARQAWIAPITVLTTWPHMDVKERVSRRELRTCASQFKTRRVSWQKDDSPGLSRIGDAPRLWPRDDVMSDGWAG